MSTFQGSDRPARKLARSRNRKLSLTGQLLAAFVLIAVLGLRATSTPVSAQQASESQAYVWANDPTADSYTPDERYQFNTTYEKNTITRTGVGAYTVFLPNMAKEGNVQVTATSAQTEMLDAAPFALGQVCEIAGEPKSAQKVLQEFVTCVDVDGAPVDTGFTLLYTNGDVYLGAYSAYLWANDPAAESYTPDERYQFNSTQAVNTISHSETGVYVVSLPGLGVEAGDIQVTAANSGPGIACTVEKWKVSADQTKTVYVDCFDADGAAADSSFTLLHAVGAMDSDTVTIWPRGAYVWVNHGEQAARYTPGKAYQFNTLGGTNEAEWTDTGKYTVYLPGIGVESGNLHVTAFGSETAAISCSIPRWSIDGADYAVDVVCFDAEGNPANSRFMLSYVYPEP